MATPETNGYHPNGYTDHAIYQLRASVDYTHPGLGALAAISAVAAKARQCLLVIGPPGTGKSAVSHWLGEELPEAYVRGDITMAALRKFNDELSNSEAAIIIDDLGECNSEWNRAQTCIAISALCYGHDMVKDTHQTKVEILNFYGSGWIGLQPSVMAEVVKHPSFHSNLRDKSLRYYHLQRPLDPNYSPIPAKIDWGVPLNDVVPIAEHPAAWEPLMEVGRIEWSYARAREHLERALRALAALDNRYSVQDADYYILSELTHTMTIERHVVEKQGFDSQATLHQNLLCLLAEFATYPVVTYDIIGSDYGIRPRKVQSILEDMHEWYYKVGENPVQLRMSELLRAVLEEAGIR